MNWAQAFARQAESDLNAREILVQQAGLPACHALHHLQMACEKICKASMIASGDHRVDFSESFEPAGTTLLKILRSAIEDLQK